MSAYSHRLDQVKYPRMERQDLTQGQLGSFKFTPTDEIRQPYPPASPQLTQQSQRPRRVFGDNPQVNAPYVTAVDAARQQCFTEQLLAAQEAAAAAISPARYRSEYFDNVIKPDLARSRLALGTKAFRAAVDGPHTSPQRSSRRFKDPDWGLRADTTTQAAMSAQDGNGFYQTPPNDQFPVLNPSTRDDNGLLHTSLARALSAEQEAHQMTKRTLDMERGLRIQAEAETQKLQEHSRSLIGTVNMLKSIIQHNMKKEEEAVQKAECARFYKEVKTARPRETLLHDAVKNLRQPGQVSAQQPPKSAPAPVPADDSSNNHLFDFDLVDAVGSQSLRNHFSASTTRREKTDETQTSGYSMPISSVDKSSTDEGFVICEPANEESSQIKETPKSMAMPFDANVQWKQGTIFDDYEDKVTRIGTQSSIFSSHPVRYIPDQSDKNLYRTIMIDFIPENTTNKEVLAAIRGGRIESFQLVGPVGKSTNFMTARVVFSYEREARNVYKRGQDPGIEIKGKRVRVWQVLEPTYPRTKEMEEKIFEEGYSRILLVNCAVKASLDKLPQKLARQIQSGAVVDIGVSFDGIPMVEFTSVAECSKALDQLVKDPDFSGTFFDFEEDHCAAPYPA